MKIPLSIFCIFIYQIGISQPDPNPSPSETIKILSWNIYLLPGFIQANGKMERATSIGEILSESDYDVIVFQEAFHHKARKKIADYLSKSYPYQSGPANLKAFSLKTNSGIWIFSKYPIVSSHAIAFKNRCGIDALSRKGALLVELNIHNRIIQIAGTHLQNSGEEWVRQSQCVEFYHRLLKPFYKESVPQIICGDFNIDQRKAQDNYQFMLQSLQADNGKLSGNNQYSYDRSTNDLKVEPGTTQDLIDYILVRKNGGWIDSITRSVKVIRKPWHPKHKDLSDHYSLEAEITFSNIPFLSVSSLEPPHIH